MGKGWKKSNWNSAACREFTVHSVVSKKVLRISFETSFDAFPVIDAGADHLQEAVLDAVEGVGANSAESQALVERSDGKHPAIAGELPRRWLDHERRAEKIQALWLVWS